MHILWWSNSKTNQVLKAQKLQRPKGSMYLHFWCTGRHALFTFSLTALCNVVMALRKSPVDTRPKVDNASSESSTPSAAERIP